MCLSMQDLSQKASGFLCFSDSLLSAALIFAAFQQGEMPQLLFSNETCPPDTVVANGNKITYQTKVTVESESFKLEIPHLHAARL